MQKIRWYMSETFIYKCILLRLVMVMKTKKKTDSQTSLTMQIVLLMPLTCTIFTMWCSLSCQLYYFESLRLCVTCCLVTEGLWFLFQSNPQTD